MITEVFEYVSNAGFIGWPIIGLSVVLWSVLGYRWSLLRLPKGFNPERVSNFRKPETPGESLFLSMFSEAKEMAVGESKFSIKEFNVRMNEYLQTANVGSKVVGSIVAVAPLMGLLGTVAGMIVTFRSMESMALFSQGGGIAGGISQALITTQMGLAVAIPGVLIGKMLASKQKQFEQVVDYYRTVLQQKLDEGESGHEV